MSFDSRAYDNEHGDPVVVLVVEGTHDVSRLIALFNSGNCEQVHVGEQMLRQVRRHNGGRAALQLLAAHGGPDFLFEREASATQPMPTFEPGELDGIRAEAADYMPDLSGDPVFPDCHHISCCTNPLVPPSMLCTEHGGPADPYWSQYGDCLACGADPGAACIWTVTGTPKNAAHSGRPTVTPPRPTAEVA